MDKIVIKERIQCGDVFLLKFDCLDCNETLLQTYPLKQKDCCKKDISKAEIDIKHSRLLVGTRRLGKIRKKVIQDLLNIQGPNCAYCGIRFNLTGYHVEHIMPLSAGGTNNIENLCLSCPACNMLASSKVFATFEGKKQYLLNKQLSKSPNKT